MRDIVHLPQKIKISSLKEMEILAQKIGKDLKMGDVITLEGDLGAGKTTFTRFLIQSLLGPETEVPSPTYTLVQTYDLPQGTLWHFDLYRLNDPEEIWELGFEEAESTGIMIIEWPDRLGPNLPKKHIAIRIQMGEDDVRIVEVKNG